MKNAREQDTSAGKLARDLGAGLRGAAPLGGSAAPKAMSVMNDRNDTVTVTSNCYLSSVRPCAPNDYVLVLSDDGATLSVALDIRADGQRTSAAPGR